MEKEQKELKEILDYFKIEWNMNSIDRLLNWINQANNEEQKVFLKLLENFAYYTHERVNNIFKDLHSSFTEEHSSILKNFKENAYENTLFLPVYKNNKDRTSSYDMHGCYRITNGLSKHCFKTDLYFLKKDSDFPIEKIDNIVFIDDMIGTGKTMKKFLESIFEECAEEVAIRNKRFFLIVLEACEEGINFINKFVEQQMIDLTIIYSNLHKKAFSNQYIFLSDELNSSKKLIYDLEVKINNNKLDNVLGYKGSESLMAFYHNTPNNTLSSFWKENEIINWNPLFPRIKNDNPFYSKQSLSERKKTQKRSNYIAKTL